MSEQSEIYKGMGKKFSMCVLACFSIQQKDQDIIASTI